SPYLGPTVTPRLHVRRCRPTPDGCTPCGVRTSCTSAPTPASMTRTKPFRVWAGAKTPIRGCARKRSRRPSEPSNERVPDQVGRSHAELGRAQRLRRTRHGPLPHTLGDDRHVRGGARTSTRRGPHTV